MGLAWFAAWAVLTTVQEGRAPIRVAVAASAAGAVPSAAPGFLRGAELAVSELPAIGGRRVELVPLPVRSTEREMRVLVSELATENVAALVAPLDPALREVTVEAARRAGLPVVSFAFRAGDEEDLLATVLRERFRCARLAILGDDEARATHLRQELERRWATPDALVPGQPEVVAVARLPERGGRLSAAIADAQPQVLLLDGAQSAVAEALADPLHEAALPVVLTARSAEAAAAGSGERFAVQGRAASTVVGEAPFSGEAVPGTVEGYESVKLILSAIEHAGSTHADALAAALDDAGFDGPRGHVSSDASGEIANRIALWRWSERTPRPYVPLEPVRPSGPQPAPEPEAALGAPFGLLRTAAFELEPGTRAVAVHYGDRETSTIAGDLARLGLSTEGASPLLDHLVREELLARALSMLSTKYLRDALGRAVEGRSLRISFAARLPARTRATRTLELLLAGDDTPSAGTTELRKGRSQVYSSHVGRVVFRDHALHPALAPSDLELVDGTYAFGSDPDRDRRSEAIRALVQSYAATLGLTGAHEVGHLLGLEHTEDALCVMNVNEGVGVPVERVRFSSACMARLQAELGVE